MKTIQEAASELYESTMFKSDLSAHPTAMFEAAVKFTEEWISVDEEYPNKENGYEDEPVLCKLIVGSIQPKTEYTVSVCNRNKFKCETDWVFVESWRPINRK